MRYGTTIRSALAAAAAAEVVAGRPDLLGWSRALSSVARSDPALRVDDLAVLAAGTLLWLLATWVLIALGAGALARVPGTCGVLGRALVRVAVPRVMRGVVVGSVAGGLLLGPAVAASAAPVWPTTPAASTATTTPGPAWPTSPAAGAPSTPGPAWPTSPPVSPPASPPGSSPTSPPTTTPAPPAPTAPTAPAPSPTPAAPPAPTTPGGATSVVVAPGDSLWSIASDSLRAGGTDPTDGRIAAVWPAWYATNRAVIGDDPGLLLPGTALSAPTSTDGSTS